MKFLKLAPLAMLAFASAANANVLVANTYDVNNINQQIIEDRLSMAGPLFNGWDRTYRQGNPWAEAYGYTNRMRNDGGELGKIKNRGAGLALGYDHVIADNFRIGLAVNGGTSRLKNELAPGHATGKTYGINLYSTWTGKKVNVIANVGYTHEKDTPKIGDPDVDFDDIKTSAVNAGIRFETSFVAGGLSFVPYYGVRFSHLSGDSFGDTYSDDGEVTSESFRVGDANIWQFPVGVNVGFEYTCAGGWKSRSMLDLSIIPTAGRRKVVNSSFDGEDDYRSDTRFADSVQYKARVGLQLSKGQHSFGFLYGAAAAAHGSVHQNLTLNYQFMY